MKTTILLTIVLTIVINIQGQQIIDSLYSGDKEYEEIQVDTNELYKKLYRIDTVEFRTTLLTLGGIAGSIIMEIASKLCNKNGLPVVITGGAVVIMWIGTKIYFYFKTRKIEKYILQERSKMSRL